MTPEDKTYQQQLRAKAQQDITDIDALAKSDPFNRFWVNELNVRYKAEVKTSLTANTLEAREAARSRALALDEISQMPAKIRESAERLLRTPLPQEARPTQAG